MCSICRDPQREEYTICTAVAPNEVFTVSLRLLITLPAGSRRMRTNARHLDIRGELRG